MKIYVKQTGDSFSTNTKYVCIVYLIVIREINEEYPSSSLSFMGNTQIFLAREHKNSVILYGKS